jgi:AraC-like DNA-binding protein
VSEPGAANRRALPEFGMSRAGAENLREAGVVVIPFMESVTMDPQRMQPHYHEFFQIFLLQGQAAVMHDFVEFNARGQTIVFLSPGQVHFARPKPGLRGHTVSFTQAFFDHHAPPPSSLFDFPFFFATDTRPWLKLPPGDPFRLVEAMTDLQREFDAAEAGAAEVLRALLHILLVRANRLYLEVHPPKKASRAAHLMRQFHLAVEQRFRELHAVPDYARLLGVTPNHLHDVVREQTGRSAGDLIRQRRMLDAKRLLSHSDLTVAEIAYQLGFEDPSYFTRSFKRLAGHTPAEFRGRIREKYQRNNR